MHFRTMFFCATAQPPFRIEPAPPSYQRVYELFPTLRRQLLEHAKQMNIMVTVPGCLPAALLWMPTGTTAGAALWTHETHAQAVSLILAGLDEREEEQAIDLVKQFAALGSPPHVFHEIEDADRPLLATLYRDAAVADDDCVAAASLALAAAFFSNLGIGEKETSGSAW